MMFCSNQKLSINGDKEDTLRLTLKFVLELSGWANTPENMKLRKTKQPQAYSVDPVKGVILYWHDTVKGAITIPPEMRTEEAIVSLIWNYLHSPAVIDQYACLKKNTYQGDSWLREGWECYIPTIEYYDKIYGLPSDIVNYAIVGFRPDITRYDK